MNETLLITIGFTSGWIIIGVLIYALMSLSLQKLAHKTNTKNGWLAWIPILNLFLIPQIAHKKWWWGFFLFIPLANLIVIVKLFWKICELINKPGPLSLLILVPGVSIIFLIYIGFCK